jgi:molybdopterin converting factor small subunit
MVAVLIPSQLISYTDGATRVAAEGATVGAVLADLDRQFSGIRFRVIDEQDRVRRHVRLLIGQDETRDLARAITPSDELMIFGALSGG